MHLPLLYHRCLKKQRAHLQASDLDTISSLQELSMIFYIMQLLCLWILMNQMLFLYWFLRSLQCNECEITAFSLNNLYIHTSFFFFTQTGTGEEKGNILNKMEVKLCSFLRSNLIVMYFYSVISALLLECSCKLSFKYNNVSLFCFCYLFFSP